MECRPRGIPPDLEWGGVGSPCTPAVCVEHPEPVATQPTTNPFFQLSIFPWRGVVLKVVALGEITVHPVVHDLLIIFFLSTVYMEHGLESCQPGGDVRHYRGPIGWLPPQGQRGCEAIIVGILIILVGMGPPIVPGSATSSCSPGH